MGAENNQDRFLYRLLGGIAAGVGLLVTLAAWDHAVIRLPRLREILQDFDVPLPGSTEFFLQYPWLPLVFSIVASLAGVVCVFVIRRALLVVAVVLCFLSIATLWLADFSLQQPLRSLMQAVSSQ